MLLLRFGLLILTFVQWDLLPVLRVKTDSGNSVNFVMLRIREVEFNTSMAFLLPCQLQGKTRNLNLKRFNKISLLGSQYSSVLT